jgi:hypothetical protein
MTDREKLSFLHQMQDEARAHDDTRLWWALQIAVNEFIRNDDDGIGASLRYYGDRRAEAPRPVPGPPRW